MEHLCVPFLVHHQLQPAATTTTTTSTPKSCTYDLNDIKTLNDTFYSNRNSASVIVDTILTSEQKIVSEVACLGPCSDDCPEQPINPATVAQFDRYYGGNERAIQYMMPTDYLLHQRRERYAMCLRG